MATDETAEQTLTRLACNHIEEARALLARVDRWELFIMLQGVVESLEDAASITPDDGAGRTGAGADQSMYAIGWYAARGLTPPKSKRRRKPKPRAPGSPGDGP